MILFGLLVAAAVVALWVKRWLDRLDRQLAEACRLSMGQS